MTAPDRLTQTASRAGAQETGQETRHEVAEYALLGLLREGPRHGYRLAAEFTASGRLGVALRLKMGQMYAYLHKLERQGLLVAHDESGAAARRTRRVFALTADGERTFDAWLAAPVEATREVRLAFLLKLAFTLDNPQAALALLDRQRAATAAWLERLRARDAQAGGSRGPQGPAHGALGRLALRHRILLTEAALAWLDETRAEVAAKSGRE
ncbi:MAG TPA: PadR family transcriptional regulator [Ktedonobacterales bacterium]|nr:PadR family transcriptional regulator [Ktedonobacterales bacterium]